MEERDIAVRLAAAAMKSQAGRALIRWQAEGLERKQAVRLASRVEKAVVKGLTGGELSADVLQRLVRRELQPRFLDAAAHLVAAAMMIGFPPDEIDPDTVALLASRTDLLR